MKNNEEICTFDKTAEYKKKIQPIIDQLVTECTLLDIPMFVTCCTKSTVDNTFYETNLATSPQSHQIPLKYDKITRHIAVTAGFELTPRKFQEDIDEAINELELNMDLSD